MREKKEDLADLISRILFISDQIERAGDDRLREVRLELLSHLLDILKDGCRRE